MKHGPNMQRIIATLFANNAIPAGGGLEDGIAALMPGKIQEGMKRAEAEALKMMRVVKSAPDNPFGNDNEAIAGYVLRHILELKESAKKCSII